MAWEAEFGVFVAPAELRGHAGAGPAFEKNVRGPAFAGSHFRCHHGVEKMEQAEMFKDGVDVTGCRRRPRPSGFFAGSFPGDVGDRFDFADLG